MLYADDVMDLTSITCFYCLQLWHTTPSMGNQHPLPQATYLLNLQTIVRKLTAENLVIHEKSGNNTGKRGEVDSPAISSWHLFFVIANRPKLYSR